MRVTAPSSLLEVRMIRSLSQSNRLMQLSIIKSCRIVRRPAFGCIEGKLPRCFLGVRGRTGPYLGLEPYRREPVQIWWGQLGASNFRLLTPLGAYSSSISDIIYLSQGQPGSGYED